MDNKDCRPAQIPSQVIGGEAVASGAEGMEGGDWRTQLPQDARQRVINKIMVSLKRHLPFSGEHGLQEHRKLAVKSEERIYAAATSQLDYLRKISLMMSAMETKPQDPMAYFRQSNAPSNSKNPVDPVVRHLLQQRLQLYLQKQKQMQLPYIMHQQQLGPQTNLSGSQQQPTVGIQAKQQQMQQNMANMLPNQGQQPMQQQANNTQQRTQTSVPLLQQQTTIDQQKHLLPLQRVMPEEPLRNMEGSQRLYDARPDPQPDQLPQMFGVLRDLIQVYDETRGNVLTQELVDRMLYYCPPEFFRALQGPEGHNWVTSLQTSVRMVETCQRNQVPTPVDPVLLKEPFNYRVPRTSPSVPIHNDPSAVTRAKVRKRKTLEDEVCPICYKKGHSDSRCRKKLGSCWRCGDLNHKVKDCSLPPLVSKKRKAKGDGSAGRRAKGKEKVLTMDESARV